MARFSVVFSEFLKIPKKCQKSNFNVKLRWVPWGAAPLKNAKWPFRPLTEFICGWISQKNYVALPICRIGKRTQELSPVRHLVILTMVCTKLSSLVKCLACYHTERASSYSQHREKAATSWTRNTTPRDREFCFSHTHIYFKKTLHIH